MDPPAPLDAPGRYPVAGSGPAHPAALHFFDHPFGGKAVTEKGTVRVKRGLADMLKGGVIMDVTTAEQAK
ncbi:MAG: hypothetical protein ACRDI1_02655, partial [Actinomycetota bacterium]